MEAYKRWVQRNRDYVHSLESLANGLTWLLPERFSESEIGPEAVFERASCPLLDVHLLWSDARGITSILGIITSINEHILDTPPIQTRTGHVESSSFPFSLCITLLKDLETLVEVVAQQFYGEEKKWNFMAITESIKVLLRLTILRKSGYKMLLHGGENINSPNESTDFDSLRSELLSKPGQSSWNLEGRALSALSSFGENARAVSEPTWLRRVQHQQAIMEPPAPVRETPSLSTFLSEKGIPGGLFLTGELKRRKLLWALYLMRDPFFTKYTRRRLDSTQKLLEPIPIIGLLTGRKTCRTPCWSPDEVHLHVWFMTEILDESY
ncbi:hypothetical protein DH2020_002277 [Rehmannia glutinosa]|uniref:Peroxisomal membrane protein PEX16 n=1 Tax=Rehmannia glutinosa TaxID=99300 RepID=A0ABR0XTU7_REHGL